MEQHILAKLSESLNNITRTKDDKLGKATKDIRFSNSEKNETSKITSNFAHEVQK